MRSWSRRSLVSSGARSPSLVNLHMAFCITAAIWIGGCAELPTELVTVDDLSTLLSTAAQGGGTGYDLGFTHQECITDLSKDADRDNLNDDCENALAAAFVPVAIFYEGNDCLLRDGRFAVSKTRSKIIKLFYMPGYYRDCGVLSFGEFRISAHNGDSEFIDLSVTEEGGRWLLNGAFLSAHFGSSWAGYSFDRSKDYHHSAFAFEWATAYRGGPDIHIAQFKHANYNSQARCLQVTHDTCPTEDAVVDWLMSYVRKYPERRNIGSAHAPLVDCVGSVHGHPGTECYWTPQPDQPGFLGWQGVATDGNYPTPYHKTLALRGHSSDPVPLEPSVTLVGPRYVPPRSYCAWNVEIRGGTAPYKYFWRLNNEVVSETGWYQDRVDDQPYLLGVEIYDAYGHRTTAYADVTFDETAEPCDA